MLKITISNLCTQPSGKKINDFNLELFLGSQAFTMTQRHGSTTLCTVEIAESGNANISKTSISFYKVKKKSCKFQGVVRLGFIWHWAKGLQISTLVNQ